MLKTRQQFGGLGNRMFQHAYIYSQARDGYIPDVYIQSEKHFRKYASEIKRLYGENIEYSDAVSIHVRRGDYLSSNDFYSNLCETNYYQEAIKHFPDDDFLIFCKDGQSIEQDIADREWCINFFTPLLGDRFEMQVALNEIDDLNDMAGCKSNIMANSSFSWWASYLNPNPDKKVICPKQWFSDGEQRCELLDSWITI